MRVLEGAKYYGICLKLQFQKKYVIWIGDEIDTVQLDENAKVIAFNSQNDLLGFCKVNKIKLEDEVTVFDIGSIQQWLVSPDLHLDYNVFLNFWNLCADISESLKLSL